MSLRVKPYWLMVTILSGALILHFVVNGIAMVAARSDIGYRMRVDFSVPAGWGYKYDFTRPYQTMTPGSIGLDFMCQDLYLRCAGTGMKVYQTYCPGDPYERPFLYPPLMAKMMIWLKLLDTRKAVGLWSLFILASLLGLSLWGLWRMARRNQDPISLKELFLPAFLLAASYPALFAFERGNNDVLVLWLLFAMMECFLRRRFGALGFLAMTAFLLKIYPLLPAAAIGAWFAAECWAFIRSGRFPWREMGSLKALGGMLAAGVLFFAPLYREYHYFWTVHFPRCTAHWAQWTGMPVYNHALAFAYGRWGFWLGIILAVAGIVSFGLQGARGFSSLKRDPAAEDVALMAFFYLAGLSTFLSYRTESYDYNLIVLLPLFCLMAFREARRYQILCTAGMAALLLGYAMPRWTGMLFQTPGKGFFSLPLFLETGGLLILAVYQVMVLRPRADSNCRPPA